VNGDVDGSEFGAVVIASVADLLGSDLRDVEVPVGGGAVVVTCGDDGEDELAWYLLSDPGAHFTDLGPDWDDRLAPRRRKRQLIAELERLSGTKVTLREREAA
jgi:transposase